jgi:hypothetical protein
VYFTFYKNFIFVFPSPFRFRFGVFSTKKLDVRLVGLTRK